MKQRSGFTLIELMMVVAIIGVLASIAIPKFAELIVKSKESAVKGKLGTIRSAITIYYSDTEGLFPGDNLDSLTAGSKYLDQIPSVEIPSQHPGSNFVDNNNNMGMNAILIADNGQWKYWNWTMPSMSGAVTQGNFWVGCTHVNTKGLIWSAE